MADRKQLILEYIISAQNAAAATLQKQNAILATMQQQLKATASASAVTYQGFNNLQKSVDNVATSINRHIDASSKQTAAIRQTVAATKTQIDSAEKLAKSYDVMARGMSQAGKEASASGRMIAAMSKSGRDAAESVARASRPLDAMARGMSQAGKAATASAQMIAGMSASGRQAATQFSNLDKQFKSTGQSLLSFNTIAKAASATSTTFGAGFIGATAAATALGHAIYDVAKNALTSLVSGFKNAISMSSQFQNTFLGLNTVAEAFGQSATAVQAAAIDLAADGLMRVDEAAQGLKNLLSTGFGLPEAINLMKGFKDIAAFNRQAALDFGYAIVSATEGIKNQNSILVDNAGLTKNLSIILKEQGLQLADLARVTSDASVRQKFYIGLLKEMSFSSGDAAKLMETYSGSVSRLGTQLQLLLVSFGDTVTKNAAVRDAFNAVSEVIVELTRAVSTNQEVIGNFLAMVVKPLVTGFGAVGKAVIEVSKLLGVFRADLQTGLKEIGPGFMGPLSQAGESAKALKEAMSNLGLSDEFLKVGDVIDNVRARFDALAERFRTEAPGYNLISIWERISGAFQDAWASIKPVVDQFGSTLWQEYGDTVLAIGNSVSTFVDVVADLIRWLGSLDGVWAGVILTIRGFLAAVRLVFTSIEGLLKLLQWFFQETKLGQFIVRTLGAVLETVGGTVAAVADKVVWLADAWERLANIWRTTKPPSMPPAPPTMFAGSPVQPAADAQAAVAAQEHEWLKEAEANAIRFVAVLEKAGEVSKIPQKWLKENAEALDLAARRAKGYGFAQAEELTAMAGAARKAANAITETGSAGSKAKTDLEQFQESVKNLANDLAEAARNGLNTEQVLRIFGSQIGTVAAAAERFPKVNLGSAIRDAIAAMDAEKVRKFGNELVAISEIPDAWGKAGDKFKVLNDAIADVGGVARVSEKWLQANADAILQIADSAEGQANPALQALAERIRAARVESEEFARSQRIAQRQLEAWVVVNQEIGDSIEHQMDLEDELYKFGRQTTDQQIRDANRNLRVQLNAIKERRDAFKKAVQAMDPVLRKQKETELTNQEWLFDQQEKLIKMEGDLRIAEALGVSEAVIKIWADAAAKIAEKMEKARSADSPGGTQITPEEQNEINIITAEAEKLRKEFLDMHKHLKKISDEWRKWEDIASNVAHLLGSLGFEGIAGDIDRMIKALAQAEQAGKQIADAAILLDNGKWMEGINTMIAGIANAIDSFNAATNSGSRVKNALGGAAVGAKIGEMAGAGIGFAFGGPVGAAIGKEVGKWGGALVGGIIGAFKKPGWKKAQEDVARNFGVRISEELAKQIEATQKQLNVSRQTATLLNLNSIIDEAGGLTARNMDKFAQQATGLFARVTMGGRDARIALEQLEGFFSQMIETMNKDMNGLASDAMLKFIQQAKQAGVEIQGVTEFLKEMADQISKGAVAVAAGFTDSLLGSVDSIKNVTEEINKLADQRRKLNAELSKTKEGTPEYKRLKRELDEVMKKFEELKAKAERAQETLKIDPTEVGIRAERVGRLLEVGFNAALESGQSFIDVLKDMAPQLDRLRQVQEQFGNQTSDALNRLFALSDWATEHPELGAAISGLNDMMKGLHNSAMLTQETFMDLGAEAAAQFQELQSSGLAAEDVFRIMQPSLQTLYELQQRYGYQVSENTQKMLDEAEAAGIVGDQHKSASERMVDGIDRVAASIGILIQAMGHQLPAALQSLVDKFTSAGQQAANGLNVASGAAQNLLGNVARIPDATTYTGRVMRQQAAAAGFEIDELSGRWQRLASVAFGTTEQTVKNFQGLIEFGIRPTRAEIDIFNQQLLTTPQATAIMSEDFIRALALVGLKIEEVNGKWQLVAANLAQGVTIPINVEFNGPSMDEVRSRIAEVGAGDLNPLAEELGYTRDQLADIRDQMNELHHTIYLPDQTPIQNLNSELDDAIANFNDLGATAEDSAEKIKDALQGLRDDFIESGLTGLALERFQLDREHREAISSWLDSMEGEAQDVIDEGLALIDATFANRLNKMQYEQGKRLRDLMHGINENLLELTLNSAELAMHKLQVEQQEMIESFLEAAEGASEDFIQEGLDKIHKIFELRAKKLRDEARDVQEVAKAMTPAVTLLGNGLLRIQGADVVFNHLSSHMKAASASAQTWSSTTTQAAETALDAINAVSFGHSPGGLKEIPLQMDAAMASAWQLADTYDREMEYIKTQVDSLGQTLDDQLMDREVSIGYSADDLAQLKIEHDKLWADQSERNSGVFGGGNIYDRVQEDLLARQAEEWDRQQAERATPVADSVWTPGARTGDERIADVAALAAQLVHPSAPQAGDETPGSVVIEHLEVHIHGNNGDPTKDDVIDGVMEGITKAVMSGRRPAVRMVNVIRPTR